MEKVPDNYFMDFPAIMSDGRPFTDYKSSCVMNKDGIGMTSFEYRNYLTQNAEKIMKNNTKLLHELAGCGECSDYSVVPPYVVMSSDESKCIQRMRSPEGLGVEIQASINKERQQKLNYIQQQVTNQTNSL